MILYEDNKDMHWGSNQTNVVTAAFVTAQARLKLFNEMLILGERVLYVDTDSIIYKRSLDLYTPKLGDFLGDYYILGWFAPGRKSPYSHFKWGYSSPAKFSC